MVRVRRAAGWYVTNVIRIGLFGKRSGRPYPERKFKSERMRHGGAYYQ